MTSIMPKPSNNTSIKNKSSGLEQCPWCAAWVPNLPLHLRECENIDAAFDFAKMLGLDIEKISNEEFENVGNEDHANCRESEM